MRFREDRATLSMACASNNFRECDVLHVRDPFKARMLKTPNVETHHADSGANVLEMSSAWSTFITKDIGDPFRNRHRVCEQSYPHLYSTRTRPVSPVYGLVQEAAQSGRVCVLR